MAAIEDLFENRTAENNEPRTTLSGLHGHNEKQDRELQALRHDSELLQHRRTKNRCLFRDGNKCVISKLDHQGRQIQCLGVRLGRQQLESLAKTKENQVWKHAFWSSLSFAIPVFVISILPMYLPALKTSSFEPCPGLSWGSFLFLSQLVMGCS